jgi:hypothetical protein
VAADALDHHCLCLIISAQLEGVRYILLVIAVLLLEELLDNRHYFLNIMLLIAIIINIVNKEMVYKIRNKGFNNTAAALNPRVHPAKKTKIHADLTRYITMQVQITRFTGMRILHNYRNISRASK